MKTFQVQCELDYAAADIADYVFNIEAAIHPWQQILHDQITVTPHTAIIRGRDPRYQNRLIQLHGTSGALRIQYEATVDANYPPPSGLEEEVPIAGLPLSVLPYLWPSRYCESDAMLPMALRAFAHLPRGYQRVEAICRWIRDHIDFLFGVSNSLTSARDVLVSRAGVCRDYAHLGIAFCRALNIPARYVTGYTVYADPPTDFHAVFEAYLGGRWILFDASQLAPMSDFIRIATGTDAADTAFATIFGPVKLQSLNPSVRPLITAIGCGIPYHSTPVPA